MRFHRYTALKSALMLLAAACGGTDAASNAASNTAARQIELAPTKQAPPELNDAPLPAAAPATRPVKKAARAPEPVPIPAPRVQPPQSQPVVPAPASAPAPAATLAPTAGTVATGTPLTLTPSSRICTNTHHEGDRFTATLASAVQGTNGIVIPAGSGAVFRILESTRKAGGKDSLNIAYDIVSIKVGDETYEVVAHMTESTPLQYVNIQSTTDKATKIGAGAVIGAIAGRILGGNAKGTVIGGVVGGVAGAAVANNTRDYIGCISESSSIALALDRPLTVRLAAKAP